jgi:hypothetical protein
MEQKSKISVIRHEKLSFQMAERLRLERFWAIVLLIIALSTITLYGTLKNPFINTFSRIGNYYNYRGLYIIWAIVVSICIHTVTILIFKLTGYPRKWGYLALALSSFFLIITAIIPSLKEELPFWHALHKWTTFFYVMSMLTAQHPFFVWLARKIPRIKVLLRNWQLIILCGSMTSLLIQGQTGIFELWFFLGLGALLIYLSWILFTEKINEAEHYGPVREQEDR